MKRSARERILTRLHDAEFRQIHAHRDELAGFVRGNGALVGGFQVKARDVFGFLHLALDHEWTPARPTAVSQGLFLVDASFHADENVGQLTVGGSPRFDQFVVGGFAQHFLDGCEKVFAHDAVLFGADADCAVLGGDVLDGVQKHHRVFNVFSVGQNGARQCLLLVAARLVRVVKDVLQLGVAREHALVEMRDQRNAVFAQDRDGGFDKFFLTGGQHGFLPVWVC